MYAILLDYTYSTEDDTLTVRLTTDVATTVVAYATTTPPLLSREFVQKRGTWWRVRPRWYLKDTIRMTSYGTYPDTQHTFTLTPYEPTKTYYILPVVPPDPHRPTPVLPILTIPPTTT